MSNTYPVPTYVSARGSVLLDPSEDGTKVGRKISYIHWLTSLFSTELAWNAKSSLKFSYFDIRQYASVFDVGPSQELGEDQNLVDTCKVSTMTDVASNQSRVQRIQEQGVAGQDLRAASWRRSAASISMTMVDFWRRLQGVSRRRTRLSGIDGWGGRGIGPAAF